MKKWIYIVTLSILVVALCACSKITPIEDLEKWDCTVICAEESSDDSYIIAYSKEEIISKAGTLSFQNKNDFDIVVHLLTEEKEERIVEIGAGGMAVLYQVEKEIVYTVGCHADVEEGIEIKLTVYDGENAEVY